MTHANAVYRIPEGTPLLVPPTVHLDNGKGVTMFWDNNFRIEQCIPSRTTREVTYTDEDLAYDPHLKESFGKFPEDFMGVRELDYYVFKLPDNSRHVPYIFVPYDDVEVVKNRLGPTTGNRGPLSGSLG